MQELAEQSREISTARTPGFDVARALAVLGMVLVNYAAMLDAEETGPAWLIWCFDRLEGRAGALFVVLAGVGVSLRSRRAREQGRQALAAERGALIKRALVLFAVGLLHLHLWDWDILHCYGLYLACAALLLGAGARVLWGAAALSVGVAIGLHLSLTYEVQPPPWSIGGIAVSMIFDGLYPLFPWLAFLIVGMVIGRLDLRVPAARRRTLACAVAVAFVGEGVGHFADALAAMLAWSEDTAVLLGSWPRPPTPAFVLAAGGMAVAVICVCVGIAQPRAHRRWLVTLTATGQMAFSLYVAHTVAILIPVQHGALQQADLPTVLVCGLVFYAAAMAVSVWWRRRWSRGPLEALIRQITGRTHPAPWGGALVTDAPASAASTARSGSTS